MLKKITCSVFAFYVLVFAAVAETDSKAIDILTDIQKGKNNHNQIETLRVSGNATVGGTLTVTGTITPSGVVTGGTFNGAVIQASTIKSGSVVSNAAINTGTIKAVTIQDSSLITGCTITNSAIQEPSSVYIAGGNAYTGTNTWKSNTDGLTNTVVIIKGIIKSFTQTGTP